MSPLLLSQQTLDFIKKNLGLEASVEGEQVLVAAGVRAELIISLPVGDLEIPYEIIRYGGGVEPNGVVYQMTYGALGSRFLALIVGSDMPSDLKAALRSSGHGYLDLTKKDFLIPVANATMARPEVRTRQTTSSEGPRTGKEQVLFALLSNKRLLQASIRQIASEIGLPPSTVAYHLKLLIAAGDVTPGAKGFVFRDYAHELNRWTNFFAKQVKVLTKPQKFRDKGPAQRIALTEPSGGLYYWSGDAAASILLGSLIATEYIIYCDDEARGAVISRLKLVPDESGSIELRSKFWSFDWPQATANVAPLPIVYADLMLSDDSRARVAALEIVTLKEGV